MKTGTILCERGTSLIGSGNGTDRPSTCLNELTHIPPFSMTSPDGCQAGRRRTNALSSEMTKRGIRVGDCGRTRASVRNMAPAPTGDARFSGWYVGLATDRRFRPRHPIVGVGGGCTCPWSIAKLQARRIYTRAVPAKIRAQSKVSRVGAAASQSRRGLRSDRGGIRPG